MEWLNAVIDWLNHNGGAITAGATVVLAILTYLYLRQTSGLRKTSEDNLRELQKQHLDHQEQYRAEKEELRKTCVVPVQWRVAIHGTGSAPSSIMEIQLDNLGPGAAKDIEVRGYRKQGDNAFYRYGFFPGLVAGGIRWMTVSDATQGQFATWDVDTWETPQTGLVGAPMVVEVRCKTILDEEVAAFRRVILKGDDVHYPQ